MGLTDTAIHNARPGGKPRQFTDEKGLYLEVAPAGGKQKRISLGVYPGVSLKDARERRDAARKLVASGVDPSEHRTIQKAAGAESAANSFEVVAREWFAKHPPNWSTA